MSYELARPILEFCSPETLLRIEDNTPRLKSETNDLWEAQCRRFHSLPTEQYCASLSEPPSSWREFLKDEEAKRFEVMSSRIKRQRLELEERKKEKEIKFTNKLPPSKRTRGCGDWYARAPEIFIRKDAFRRGEGSEDYNTVSAKPPPPTCPSSTTPVVVRPVTIHHSRPKETPTHSSPAFSSSNTDNERPPKPTVTKPVTPQRSAPPQERPIKPLPSGKKTATSSLFMPKHRAHSQLPSQTSPPRARARG
ncbi:hypothetical protein EWM64_g1031 [Hericium alpestre]|uniref:Elongin-A n=1 Tax=Hericium alpestre TaxID=135208 RepID=A0A4Z0A8W6_9AGAM|nr:hypothetical protein EWM64_g1031 [Hericium alpestre]